MYVAIVRLHPQTREGSKCKTMFKLNYPIPFLGFLWCVQSYGFCGESGIVVFRGVDRDPSEVWSLVRFMFLCKLQF